MMPWSLVRFQVPVQIGLFLDTTSQFTPPFFFSSFVIMKRWHFYVYLIIAFAIGVFSCYVATVTDSNIVIDEVNWTKSELSRMTSSVQTFNRVYTLNFVEFTDNLADFELCLEMGISYCTCAEATLDEAMSAAVGCYEFEN